MKQFRVFVRGAYGIWRVVEDDYTITFHSSTTFIEVTIWYKQGINHSHFDKDGEVAMLSDIDPDNIPGDCRCVVCKMVTDRYCEGDLVRWRQSLAIIDMGVLLWHDDAWQLCRHGEPPFGLWKYLSQVKDKFIDHLYDGHILTHRIVAGDVVAR